MKKGGLTFEQDKIVVGGCVKALLYASLRELPVVFSRPAPPFRFDLFPANNLSKLGFELDETTTSREVWERLMFLLGLSGLALTSGFESSLRVDGKTLVVSSGSRSIRYNFNKLVIFDDKEIKGLPRIAKEEKASSRVIDWVNVRSGCSHDFHRLEDDGSSFVREIIFYPSERSDNKNWKDLAAVSYLTDEQLNDFDYSDTMARFKIVDMMKKAGIRGARNGRDQLRPGKYKYYAVKVEPAERQVISRNVRYYEPDERFDFCYDSDRENYRNRNAAPRGYISKLCEVF